LDQTHLSRNPSHPEAAEQLAALIDLVPKCTTRAPFCQEGNTVIQSPSHKFTAVKPQRNRAKQLNKRSEAVAYEIGLRVAGRPAFADENTILRTSAKADYFVGRGFIPLLTRNRACALFVSWNFPHLAT
jgi:hypothetical protein